MADFKGGVKEAAKMLMALEGEARKRLLEEIRQRDPKMAEQLQSNLISIEDIQFLTPGMLVALLRELDMEKFGLALRTVDQDIVDKILNQLSTNMRLEINEGRKGKPVPVSKVQEAQDIVLEVLKRKVDQGHIVIDKDEQLV
ncbi:MAG: hypothetical protein CME62_01820 [Halobacteriovoraceae bacterium]|nr:hypothetical protein [Halobacteriovoraceae bacterium]|tara:strand:+ start:2149 stop:2574 length:426 start_codon:yes stop_codon:yes gene_type:complete